MILRNDLLLYAGIMNNTLTDRLTEYQIFLIWFLCLKSLNGWVILLQAVMLYTLMCTWPRVSSTGATSAALWRIKMGSDGSSQMAPDYIV